ncbi:hypothetical protein BJ165DRAFT_336275 [Panaeolus papilionaceus]|nr:hypothetical protein BJ165DRAFT_336275 [Panaeolus papilionaceus]
MTRSDVAVKSPGILGWNRLNRRNAATATTGTAGKKTEDGDEEEDDDDDEMPAPTTGGGGVTVTVTAIVDGAPRILTKENPVVVAIYGQICFAAKSYLLLPQQPHDLPLSCHRLNRSSHAVSIQQPNPPRCAGDGVLDQIPQMRGATTVGVREVVYNFGRTFHRLFPVLTQPRPQGWMKSPLVTLFS